MIKPFPSPSSPSPPFTIPIPPSRLPTRLCTLHPVTPLQPAQPRRHLRRRGFRSRLRLAGPHRLQLAKQPRFLEDARQGQDILCGPDLDTENANQVRFPTYVYMYIFANGQKTKHEP